MKDADRIKEHIGWAICHCSKMAKHVDGNDPDALWAEVLAMQIRLDRIRDLAPTSRVFIDFGNDVVH